MHDGGSGRRRGVRGGRERDPASRFKRVEATEIAWTEEQLTRRAIKEYVDALESENVPTNPDRYPKALSPSDPCPAWTTRGRHKVMFGYSIN